MVNQTFGTNILESHISNVVNKSLSQLLTTELQILDRAWGLAAAEFRMIIGHDCLEAQYNLKNAYCVGSPEQ